MGAASRWCLRAAAIAATTSTFVGLLLPGCQFPNYNIVQQGGAGALPIGGGGMSGVAGTRDEGGAPPGDGGAGEGAEGGGGGTSGTGGADPMEPCAPDACKAMAPDQWEGPIALWEGTGDADPPDCAPGYTEPSDFYHGLVAPPGDCKCTCTPDGQSCATNTELTIYTDLSCAAPCGTVNSPSACTTVAAPACNGSQGSVRAVVPDIAGGTCKFSITEPVPAKWESAARICKPSKVQVCPALDQVCAPQPPPPYSEHACLMREVMAGESLPACPAGFPNPKPLLYQGFVDNRACSDCVCGPLTGGKCDGSLSLYGAQACTEPNPPTHPLGNDCTQFNLGSGGVSPKRVHGEYQLTPGTCSVATASKPIGSAKEDGSRFLVCCE
jgi:hypothetical protein